MKNSRVAAIQMVSGNDLHENLRVAARLLAEAADNGVALAVLPETFSLFSANRQKVLGQHEGFGERIVRTFLSEQARLHQFWIVGGTVPLAERQGSERVLSACYVINSDGEEVVRYDKIHLFDVDVGDSKGSYRESDTFVPGHRIVSVDTPVGRLGLAICYDLRFPELFRQLFLDGVELVALPAAFTRLTGQAHWLPLLRARAIENQCYMIGANQGGVHSSSRATSGGSVIIDSWGRVLTEASLGEQCVVAEINLQTLKEQREAMPVLSHRRPELY